MEWDFKYSDQSSILTYNLIWKKESGDSYPSIKYVEDLWGKRKSKVGGMILVVEEVYMWGLRWGCFKGCTKFYHVFVLFFSNHVWFLGENINGKLNGNVTKKK